MIHALMQLYSGTLDAHSLQQAITAAQWRLAQRALPGGGFRHGEIEPAGLYLEDPLAAARGMLALHAVTGDRNWLASTESAAQFIRRNFATSQQACFASAADRGQILKPTPQIDDNIAAARFQPDRSLARTTHAPRRKLRTNAPVEIDSRRGGGETAISAAALRKRALP